MGSEIYSEEGRKGAVPDYGKYYKDHFKKNISDNDHIDGEHDDIDKRDSYGFLLGSRKSHYVKGLGYGEKCVANSTNKQTNLSNGKKTTYTDKDGDSYDSDDSLDSDDSHDSDDSLDSDDSGEIGNNVGDNKDSNNKKNEDCDEE